MYFGEDAYFGYEGYQAYPGLCREIAAYPVGYCGPYPGVGYEMYPLALPRPGLPTRPLRIAHIGPSLLRAGVETWLRSLIRNLDPRRAVVTRSIVTMPGHFDTSLATELGIPTAVGGRDEVRQAAFENDVLLFWGPSEVAEWLADQPAKLGVFVAHGEGPWTRRILLGAAASIDHVVAVSRRVEEKLCAGFPVTVVPNGIDASRVAATRSRAEVRARLNFAPDDFVVGYVGRFSGEKRPESVIDAVALLPNNFKALYVGWGAQKAALLERANSLIPGRYAFTTAVNDVGDYYAALDALCLTSYEEGFGLVILEAMLAGKPVIVTQVGCVPDVVRDRISGLVVDGTAESVAAAACDLHRHPSWVRGIAAEGHAWADQHGHASLMARRYEDLLLNLWHKKWGKV